MQGNFVPAAFVVPEVLETPQFRLRPLTIHDVVKDYDAVITSVSHLQGLFGPEVDWPGKNLTLEQDLIDLAWHQKEFQLRRSFTYTVMSPTETTCLGCVYLFPSSCLGYEAEVYLWVRQSELNSGLEAELYATVKRWVQKSWPFHQVAFPGREIMWQQWLTDNDRTQS